MRVVFSELADEDLRSAITYTAGEDLQAALRLACDIEQFCFVTLAKFPNIGTVFEGDVRVFYKHRYRIFYRVFENHIEIVRIIHRAQDQYEL